MSRGIPKELMEQQAGFWASHPYWELTCDSCGATRFHHRRGPVLDCLVPPDFFTCRECGGKEISRKAVTAWHVRLHDPLGRRRTGWSRQTRLFAASFRQPDEKE